MSAEREARIKDRKEKPRQAAARARSPLNLETFLPYRFFRAAMHMAESGRGLRQLLAKSGVGIREREWRVAAIVAARNTTTPAEISAFTGMEPATVTRAVQRLEGLGYVTTRKGTRDRRRVLVALTVAGARMHDAIAPLRISDGEEIAKGLTSRERELLLNLLDKLETHMRQLSAPQREDHWSEE